MLLNTSNYGWFGKTSFRAQIRSIARLRAAELGIAVAMAGRSLKRFALCSETLLEFKMLRRDPVSTCGVSSTLNFAGPAQPTSKIEIMPASLTTKDEVLVSADIVFRSFGELPLILPFDLG